ncbi:hypothetical protein [Ralstonia sp.]|uniref:hypothetical protein n=1 Tax=Ralstonia sp. TaxID=54061 RepID=UPI00257F7A3F|nr:hypothetical protein [Ralstonia sp.]
MLLIALSGGTAAERVAIADRLVESGKGQLVAFAQATPKSDAGPSRARILRDALAGMEEAPAALGGVVVVHCLAEEEAELVRAQGGAVWHVYGQPSGLVVIRHGDPIVTDGLAGFRHVREPLEALSELLLSRLSAGGAPLALAALSSLANG